MWYFLNSSYEQCTCSQEQAEESSEECFADISLYAQSKMRNTASEHCSDDSRTEFCRNSQYGMKSKRSTENCGEEKSTLLQVDFHARIYQQRENAGVLRENILDFGKKCQELYVKFNPDTCWWRTHLNSLDEDLMLYLLILPQWGMMRNGVLSGRTMPEHLKNETECGFWLTPSTVQIAPSENRRKKRSEYRASIGRHDSPGSLEEQVQTPEFYPTPSSRDWKDTPGMSTNPDGTERKRSDQLARFVYNYPTPGTTGMSNGTGNCEYTNKLYKQGQISDEERRSMRAGNGGRLNPDWVEWLMGWPIGWTRPESVKMDWRDWRRNPADTGEVPMVVISCEERKNRIKAIGNGQVPMVIVLAWNTLIENSRKEHEKKLKGFFE